MGQSSKAFPSFREAVQDIPDGATIGFGGFAMPGVPFNLIKALYEHGAKQLTLVAQHDRRRTTAAHAGYWHAGGEWPGEESDLCIHCLNAPHRRDSVHQILRVR